MKKFTICFKISIVLAVSIILLAFSTADSIDQYVTSLQKSFIDHYDMTQESDQIKTYELQITNNGFCRYKRFYKNGKTEYFAFKLAKFKDMEYSGTPLAGKLAINTKGDDVIVQTYRDKGGDVDSMATQIVIPLKNMEDNDLNAIRENLERIKNAPQNQK